MLNQTCIPNFYVFNFKIFFTNDCSHLFTADYKKLLEEKKKKKKEKEKKIPLQLLKKQSP